MRQKQLQNLHVHTTFCDGQDTPEALVTQAIALGMDGIGFAAHASTAPFSPDGCMSLEAEPQYKNEITHLKEVYQNQLQIFLGLEFEMYSQCNPVGYDYMIGACHFLKVGNEIINYDEGSPNSMQKVIDRYFNGDGLAMAEKYYEDFLKITELQKIDIIGHFDIIRLYCDRYPIFDTGSNRYITAAIEALRSLVKKVPVFELNMSSIIHNPDGVPFPAPFLLRELRDQSGSIVITNDCHEKRYLDFGYKQAVELLQACGYHEYLIMTPHGFDGVKI